MKRLFVFLILACAAFGQTISGGGSGTGSTVSPGGAETTASSSCAVGSDFLWPDSSAHRWRGCNNATNASADTVVFLNTTDTLANKTLTSPALSSFTVAGLPAAATVNRLAIVTDALGFNCKNGGGTQVIVCRDNGTLWEAVGGLSVLTRPNNRVQRYCIIGGTGSMACMGDASTETGATSGNQVIPTSTAPYLLNETTGAVQNTSAGIRSTTKAHITGRTNGMRIQFNGSMNSNANVRWFGGISDQLPATMTASDAPVGNYAMFRFSTSAADTTHYYTCVDDNATQVCTASGLLADTNFHRFEIFEDKINSNWHFYIDGSELSSSPMASHIPTTATNVYFQQAIQNLSTNNLTLNTGLWWIDADY